MDKKNITKHYSNGEITIVWQSGKCIHSGNCVKGSPKVFKPKEAPWISPMEEKTHAIIQTINTCPSGALTYFHNKD